MSTTSLNIYLIKIMKKIICTNFDEFNPNKHWFKGTSKYCEELMGLLKDKWGVKNHAALNYGGVYHIDTFCSKIIFDNYGDVYSRSIRLNPNVFEFIFKFKEVEEFNPEKHYIRGSSALKYFPNTNPDSCDISSNLYFYINGEIKGLPYEYENLLIKAGYTEYKED